MIARIYYKSTGKYPFIWSIDKGHIRTQKVIKQFHIADTCSISGGHNLTTTVKNSPKVFLKVNYSKFVIKYASPYLT